MARSVVGGAVDPPGDPLEPPADNLILGPVPAADDLTITVGLGASMFDDRYGLADRQPRRLVPMTAFSNDRLAPSAPTATCSCRSAAAATRPASTRCAASCGPPGTPWSCGGWCPASTSPTPSVPVAAPPGTCSASRTARPTSIPAPSALMDELVWVQPDDDEPAWAAAGTYQVVRIIRMRVEFWDRTPLRTQETIIGRVKETGAPLDGAVETDAAGLRRRSGWYDLPPRRPHPPGQPADAGDRAQPPAAARLLLLAGLRLRRPLRPGSAVPVLPAGSGRGLHRGAEPPER